MSFHFVFPLVFSHIIHLLISLTAYILVMLKFNYHIIKLVASSFLVHLLAPVESVQDEMIVLLKSCLKILCTES